MPTALLSVWNKDGIEGIAQRLAASGFRLLSTGGTATALRAAGLEVLDVSSVTNFPEILDGRVKTLHPMIHGGLLARRDLPEHMATLQEHGIETIDVLVSNLYPFADVVARDGAADTDIIELIDIGGPAMVRAAAKNHPGVVVLTNPADYDGILTTIEQGGVGSVSLADRRRLAARAFEHVSTYDSLVAAWLREPERAETPFPRELSFGGRLLHTTRYGENPHQRGAVYALATPGPVRGVATWQVHDGREMSYNNYLDATAALGTALDFPTATVVVVKHTLPCGIGSDEDLARAWEMAFEGDPVSAFGGIVGCNRTVTTAMVEAIGKLRLDVIIAPDFEPAALARLLRRKNLRVISAGPSPEAAFDVRSIPGGLLVQDTDTGAPDVAAWQTVTQRPPTADELQALEYGWRAVRWVKSNAIVLSRPTQIVGIGAGQPNRVNSVRIAATIAGDKAAGSVISSDAFFPFADGIEAAAEAGVTAIAQPGGSVRDADNIAVADSLGLAMVLTGKRHFRH